MVLPLLGLDPSQGLSTTMLYLSLRELVVRVQELRYSHSILERVNINLRTKLFWCSFNQVQCIFSHGDESVGLWRQEIRVWIRGGTKGLIGGKGTRFLQMLSVMVLR